MNGIVAETSCTPDAASSIATDVILLVYLLNSYLLTMTTSNSVYIGYRFTEEKKNDKCRIGVECKVLWMFR